MAKELDGLQFAAELEFENVTDGKIVGRGERWRLQRGGVQIGIGGGKRRTVSAKVGEEPLGSRRE